jgi:hypothetical protein
MRLPDRACCAAMGQHRHAVPLVAVRGHRRGLVVDQLRLLAAEVAHVTCAPGRYRFDPPSAAVALYGPTFPAESAHRAQYSTRIGTRGIEGRGEGPVVG